MPDLTLDDIARQVGVSRSTVSRVVNEHPDVSIDVRNRVLQAIKVTGFHPNAAARSLASQRTHMIGLVLPRNVSSFFTDPFFPQLTQGIAYGCNNFDLTLSLFLVGSIEDEEKLIPRITRRGLLDGVLVQSGLPDDPLVSHLVKSDLPIVILGRPYELNGTSYIDVDNVGAALVATRHLLNLGYHRIATITGSSNSTAGVDRKSGYISALTSAGRNIEESLIAEGDFTEGSGYSGMKRLLPAKPDAVFIASDMMAAGAIRAAHEVGLRVPEDIAIVGFDDIPLGTMTSVRLTTIRQPIMQFGIKAVELLIDLIENGNYPVRRTIVDTELVIRDSCGAWKFEGKSNGR